MSFKIKEIKSFLFIYFNEKLQLTTSYDQKYEHAKENEQKYFFTVPLLASRLRMYHTKTKQIHWSAT